MDEYGSFLDLNLDEVPELKVAPANQELQLKINNVEIKESQGAKTAGQKMLNLRCSVIDEPDTSAVYEIIMLPSQEADEETNNMRKRQMKRLVEAIGWDPAQGFNIEELEGETFWAILDIEEYQGQERNRIKRYLAPQTETE